MRHVETKKAAGLVVRQAAPEKWGREVIGALSFCLRDSAAKWLKPPQRPCTFGTPSTGGRFSRVPSASRLPAGFVGSFPPVSRQTHNVMPLPGFSRRAPDLTRHFAAQDGTGAVHARASKAHQRELSGREIRNRLYSMASDTFPEVLPITLNSHDISTTPPHTGCIRPYALGRQSAF